MRTSIAVLLVLAAVALVVYRPWDGADRSAPDAASGRVREKGDETQAPLLAGRGRVAPAPAEEPPASAGEVDDCDLHVTVSDADSEKLRSGAIVRLVSLEGDALSLRVATTDGRGEAVFSARARCEYRLEIHAAGCQVATWLWAPGAPGQQDTVRISLEPGVSFEGCVLDALSGAPVEGAQVGLDSWGGVVQIGPTDDEGRFRVPGVADDEDTRLVIVAAGYARGTLSVRTDGGRAHPAQPTVRLVPGGTLRGTVYAPSGAPAEGAAVLVVPHHVSRPAREARYATLAARLRVYEARGSVSFDPFESDEVLRARTAADGAYSIAGLPLEEAYDVVARIAGSAQSERVRGVRVSAGRREETVDLTLRRGGEVHVRLGVGGEGRIVGAALVRVIVCGRSFRWEMQGEGEKRPPSDGVYRIPHVDPGAADVYVEAQGFRSAAAEVRIEDGVTTEVALALEEGHTVEGVVVDEAGRPVEACRVAAAPARGGGPGVYAAPGFGPWMAGSRQDFTDAQGRFSIGGLAAGDVLLIASVDPFTVEHILQTPSPVKATAPARGLRLVAGSRGAVKARLLLPSGEPFGGPVETYIEQPDGSGIGGWCQTSMGTLQESGLAPGRQVYIVAPQGYAWSRYELDVGAGRTVDLGDLVVDAGVSVSGRVVDDRGRPIAGVRIHCAEWHQRGTRTDADGGFSMERFPDGGFSLGFEAERHTFEWIDVTRGKTQDLRIVLGRAALIRGTCRDAEGHLVGDLQIELRPPGAKTMRPVARSAAATEDEVWYEGAEWIRVDQGGKVTGEVVPGRYIGYWTPGSGKALRLGEWTFVCGETHELEITLPKR